ncbi:MAG: type II toxin-antitoxin system ParD family antitoxin, partial [Methylobacteriaceae bacterium]|nr:type II toxin-antitoxin system ParD family antitoxin [Methylobacteriaceae bacterium]
MTSDQTRNVSLTAELNGFIRAQVASGRYQNASEVVRAALRLLHTGGPMPPRAAGARTGRAGVDPRAAPAFLSGGGELGALIRAHNWAATPFGLPESWPQSLRSALSICLHSSFPGALYWGRELRLLYNDTWAPIAADRHPWALGRPGHEVWADIWHIVGPQIAKVLDTGEGFSTYDQMLPMLRGGVQCETYWNYSFTPIRGEDGAVVGVFNQGHETTDRVLGERRDRFLLLLSDRLRSLSDPAAIIDAAQDTLGRFLGANRVGYGTVDDPDERLFLTERNWTDGSVPAREGIHDLARFGPQVLAALRRGRVLLLPDVASDPRSCAPESLAAFAAIEARAAITAPLVKEGRLRAALYVHAREPRQWSEADADLVAEVAERTWSALERGRVEAELRDSEARFRGVFDSRLTGLAIFDTRSADTLAINDAFLAMTGHSRADFDEGRWDWRDFTVVDHLPLDEAAIAQARERGWWDTYEKEYRRRDGTIFPVRISSAPLPGEPGRVVVSVQDISAARAA